ncbi:MAG: pilus assembly protein PilM, partial [Dysgonamonadaceae bacterium]|nr:pilus assembly protein PilM [Dysgonamonadaceae bacterium]
SGNAIRRGLIYNTDEATHKIGSLLQQLDRQLQQKSQPGLKKIYVGIGGQALYSQSCSFQKNVTKDEVDIALIDELENECLMVEDDSYELIEVVSREYFVDGQLDANPEGATGKVLEAKFQLIRGYASSFKLKVEQAVLKAGFEVAGYFVSPLATAEAMLTVSEKKTGCALVEIGAGLTFISIYINGLLRYLATLPMGGYAITKDICVLKNNLSETEAENLKRTEGNALTDDDNTDLNQWIEARATEIAANIRHQIQQSGYADALKAGIVLTGGAAALKNMDKLLAQQTRQTVRLASGNLSQACAWGMLLLGKENCSKPEEIKQPTDMFGQVESDSKDRKKAKKAKKGFFGWVSDSEQPEEKPKKEKPKKEKPVSKKKPDEPKKGAGGIVDFIFGD